jgi:antitoxin component YwqK of YwqJK toxin-antitoxin module
MKYIVLFFLLAPLCCQAQKPNTAADTIYINKYGSTTYKENATYYLVWQDKTEIKDKISGTLAKYTPDHRLEETYEAVYYKKHDDIDYPNKTTSAGYTMGAQKSGTSRCFYPSGKLKTVSVYKLNKPDGNYQTYHENGLPESKGRKDCLHNYIYTHTDSNGKEYLSNGSGIISEYHESLKRVCYTP